MAFGLVSTYGNFKISNIIFNGLTWNTIAQKDRNFYNFFRGSGDKGSGNKLLLCMYPTTNNADFKKAKKPDIASVNINAPPLFS